MSDRYSGIRAWFGCFMRVAGLSRSGGRVTKPRTSDRVSKPPEFRAFCIFLTFFLQFFEIYAIMASENDEAAERTRLNEADMENRKVPGGAAARRARGDVGEPGRRRKKRLGGSAQVLDKARFGQGNPSFSLGWIWPGLAGFGSIWPNLDSAWIFLGRYT